MWLNFAIGTAISALQTMSVERREKVKDIFHTLYRYIVTVYPEFRED